MLPDPMSQIMEMGDFCGWHGLSFNTVEWWLMQWGTKKPTLCKGCGGGVGGEGEKEHGLLVKDLQKQRGKAFLKSLES